MENKLTWWFVDKWGKPLARQKPHRVILTTHKNPLINNQAVTSIRNLTNYLCLSQNTNLQLNLRFNTQFKTWSCSSLLSFDAQISNLWLTLCTDPSTWLTPATLNDAAKFFTSSIIKIRKHLVTNSMAYKCRNFS